MNRILLNILFIFIFIPGANSVAQSLHKGMSFQGVIKLPSGEYPTRSGIAINARILSPNNCILREEQFTGVNISKGYVNLVIGSGAAGSNDPALTMKQVMDNANIVSGLICLNLDGSVSGNTSYNPTLPGEVGSRKLRISMYIDSIPVVADFNIRAVGYAINSETLNGRTHSDFVQTSTNITQARMEAFFSELLGGSGGAVKWNGSSFTGYDPNNGSNFTNIPNSAITNIDYSKISNVPATLAEIAGLTCLDGEVIKKVSGAWQCSSDSATAVQEYAKNLPSTGLSVNGSNQLEVQYGTTAGTAAQGNDPRIVGAFQASSALAGDVSGAPGATKVDRIQNRPVDPGIETDGVLVWSGTSWVPRQMPECAANQSITWSSATDTFSCVNISIWQTQVSGTVPVNKGGTGLTTLPSSSVLLGNADGSAMAGLACADGESLKKVAGSWTCVSGSAVMTETDPTVENFAKNAPSTGLSVVSNQLVVSYGTTAGTAAQGNDTRITGAFQAATALGGDLSGTLPNPTVAKLQGRNVDSAVVGDGVLMWDATTSKWTARQVPECTGAQQLKWTAATDVFTCENISVGVAQITGTLPVANGGTGLGALPAGSILLGNAGGTAMTGLACSNGESLKKVAGNWSCVSGAALFTETDPTVQNFAKNVVSSGLALNGSNQLMVSVDSTLSFTGFSQLRVNYGTVAGTAAQGNDSRITGAFQAATALGGDLSGTLPNPTVTKLQGRAVASTAPTDGVLTWNSTLSRWEAVIPGECTTNQTLQWSSTTDSFTCVNATVAVANINGTLPVSKGGTGSTTLTGNAVLVANSGGTAVNSVAPGANDTVLGVSGGVWASVPAGRTSCPAGYTLIGPSGDRSAFCISTNEQTAAQWYDAQLQCAGKTPAARLCSRSEFIKACVGAPGNGVVGATGNWEWIDDATIDTGYNRNAYTIGGGANCAQDDFAWITDSLTYRCCL